MTRPEVAAQDVPLWRHRRFATFWTAQTISHFGDRISELALPLIAVLALTATPMEVGLLTAAVWAPNLLALLVGSRVDRVRDKKPVLIGADLLRACALASVPVAHWFFHLTLAQLFLVALMAGVGQVMFTTAYPSFFASLVERRRYIEANSRLHGSISASFVAGPALGGQLFQHLTAPVAVLVDAVSFLISGALIKFMRAPAPPRDTDPALTVGTARQGLAFVLRSPYLRGALGCVTTVNLFTFMAQALLVLFATRSLHLSPAVIGLAFGTGAAGGVVGAVLATRLSRRFGVGRMIVSGAMADASAHRGHRLG